MEKIGKYRILSKIGQGGMGVVYKAIDPKIDRVLAIKTISEWINAGPKLRERFQREARSAAQLSHKNIITIYDYDEHEGTAYLAMEYLEGEDLRSRITKREQMSLVRKLVIMMEVGEGLAHAHTRGVIHRDLKPANIFVTRSGQVKLLDFGLARLADSELTKTGDFMGTPSYMSPEQLRGDNIDCRSDIFSAGVVFYELVAYIKPFQGDSNFSISMKVVHSEPEPVQIHDRTVPTQISKIIMRALAKNPSARYQNASEFVADLDKARQFLHRWQSPQSEDRDETERTLILQGSEFSLGADRRGHDEHSRAAAETHNRMLPHREIEGGASSVESTLVQDRLNASAIKKSLLLGTGALLIAILLASIFWKRSDSESGQDPAQPLASEQLAPISSLLEQKRYAQAIQRLQELKLRHPADAQLESLLAEANKQQEIGRLLGEAQTLANQGRYQERRSVYDQILRLDPSNQQAAALRGAVEPQTSRTEETQVLGILQPGRIKGADAGARKRADTALQEMREARSAANAARAADLAPSAFLAAQVGEKEAERLHQALKYSLALPAIEKTRDIYRQAERQALAETARLAELERNRRETAESERRRKIAELSGRAEEFFKSGKYAEVLAVSENWLMLEAQAAQPLQWKNRATALQRLVQAYESAMHDKDASQASLALGRIEQLNPADPSLIEMRRRIQVAAITGASRPMPTLDKEVMSRRRQGEQVYSWPVEHKHRRGSCRGTLLLDPDIVEYKTSNEEHNFRLAIKSTKLQVEGGKLTVESGGGEAHNFELKAAAAQELRKIWDKFAGTPQ